MQRDGKRAHAVSNTSWPAMRNPMQCRIRGASPPRFYSPIAPAPRIPPQIGEFNHSRLVVNGKHVEHWLNGTKVVEFDIGSAEVPKFLRSNLPAGSAPNAPLVEASPISLQNHSSEVWFRSIKIRVLQES
jgi:hypothetical protein